MILSNRSKTPPWPGIKLEKSLIPYCLFICEKNKSPSCPIIDKNKVIKTSKNMLISWLITIK